MREGTTSRVIAADRPYGDFYDFYSVSPEYFGYAIILSIIRCSFQCPSYSCAVAKERFEPSASTLGPRLSACGVCTLSSPPTLA
jgi:hypothetical protein